VGEFAARKGVGARAGIGEAAELAVTASDPAPARVPSLILELQRSAGNAAVTALLSTGRPLGVLRAEEEGSGGGGVAAPARPAIPEPPGTGYDGLYGSDVVGRSLTPEQVAIVREFRSYLMATSSFRGEWARRAGAITSAFSGSAAERAGLYAELQRQMTQVYRNWAAELELGADGSYIFRAKLREAVFVVGPDGRCYAGHPSNMAKVDGKYLPNYDKLRIVEPPGGATPAASPEAAPTPSGATRPSVPEGEAPPTPKAGAGEPPTPKVTGGKAPVPGGAKPSVLRTRIPGGMVTALAVQLVLEIALALIMEHLAKELASVEHENIERGFEYWVVPAVSRDLEAEMEVVESQLAKGSRVLEPAVYEEARRKDGSVFLVFRYSVWFTKAERGEPGSHPVYLYWDTKYEGARDLRPASHNQSVRDEYVWVPPDGIMRLSSEEEEDLGRSFSDSPWTTYAGFYYDQSVEVVDFGRMGAIAEFGEVMDDLRIDAPEIFDVPYLAIYFMNAQSNMGFDPPNYGQAATFLQQAYDQVWRDLGTKLDPAGEYALERLPHLIARLRSLD